ncbi:MAG: sortase, partial [Candidatus Saccharibacteria bacterium]
SMAGAPSNRLSQPAQEAAARIIRSKIDNLFAEQGRVDDSNQARNRDNDNDSNNNADWKKYHTAWQDYYQKYYEGYYSHQLKRNLTKNGDKTYFANIPPTEPETSISTDEAVLKLHQQLIGKVQESAAKVRKSRHFLPVASGIVVILIFLFLQYNRILISNVMAYISPGNIDPQNIVIDPNADITVSAEPRLIIPKINVDVPVLYDVGNDYTSQMAAMTQGVAHFAIPGASSHPGQLGNTVISGHSSNDLLDSGDYKFIFAQLEKLNIGDTIYANYQSKRYTYTVTKKEVVSPTDVSKLVYETTKPVMTLITCTPVGTATSRLLVTAEQVSPNPAGSNAAPTVTANTSSNEAIPGNSPTLFERIFGAK